MSTTLTPQAAQGSIPVLNIPNTKDYPRLVFGAPYHEMIPIAEIIEPSVLEAVEGMLPGLVPPYVQDAANAAVAAQAVLLTGSSMSGPLFLNPVMPAQDNQAASKAYVDTMISTAGVPEVPAVPSGQVWAREVGQWVPIDPTGGNFLPITGGAMQGPINMAGNAINNLPAVPNMPNGAAPAQWVLNQIAANSLYQGTYIPETNVPDLTQPGAHQNGYTWIVTTSNTSGVIISAAIPGLQGLTVFNGDNLIYSAMAGQFQIVRGGGLSLGEAEALFLPLAGGQMTGALNLYANATSPMNAVPLQQVQSMVTGAGLPEAPTNGQIYGRSGLTNTWQPVLPLGGGILTGALTLAANANQNLQAVPLQQVNSLLGNYVPLAGNVTIIGPLTMSGAGANLTLNSNASANLQAVPLQQLTGTLASYAPLASPALTGTPTLPTAAPGTNTTQAASTAFVTAAVAPALNNIGRNRLHNSAFRINQRTYVSGTALAAGAYGHDRWKAGTGGCTYTFTQTQPATTITITAGSLQQIVEALEVEGGTYTLSWTGTAQGRVNAGTYAASPVTTTGLPANTAITIEFDTGTLGMVQLEVGSAASQYERQQLRYDVANCQRFLVELFNIVMLAAYTGGAFGGGIACVTYPVTMRAQPTISATIVGGDATTGLAVAASSASAAIMQFAAAATQGQWYSFNLFASADL